MDNWDDIIREAILAEVLPEMEKNANILADCVNDAATTSGMGHASLGGAAVSNGVTSVAGDVITASVGINSVPRPSIYPNLYGGANIFALFDSGYTVRKPVNDPRILKERKAGNIIKRGIDAFRGRDSLGCNIWHYKPTGFI